MCQNRGNPKKWYKKDYCQLKHTAILERALKKCQDDSAKHMPPPTPNCVLGSVDHAMYSHRQYISAFIHVLSAQSLLSGAVLPPSPRSRCKWMETWLSTWTDTIFASQLHSSDLLQRGRPPGAPPEAPAGGALSRLKSS